MSVIISIHAPSRERLPRPLVPTAKADFNPRSLAGAIPIHLETGTFIAFQSTLPRGSDSDRRIYDGRNRISIHAPSRERFLTCAPQQRTAYFNPRSLAGATAVPVLVEHLRKISIHAPSRERRMLKAIRQLLSNFNPRSLAGANVLSERD